jgi:hypothetical protein
MASPHPVSSLFPQCRTALRYRSQSRAALCDSDTFTKCHIAQHRDSTTQHPLRAGVVCAANICIASFMSLCARGCLE